MRKIPIVPRVADEDMVEGLILPSELMTGVEDGSQMDGLYAIACVLQPVLLDRSRPGGVVIGS